MKCLPQLVHIGYFGKLPSRGDFIKAADNLSLVELLDGWLAEVMHLLTADPRWKINYDAMRPLHFAFVGTRSKRAIVGHLTASSDLSQRRYPFLSMGTIEVDDPSRFLPRSSLVLSPLWRELDALIALVLEADDPEPALQALASARFEIDPGATEHMQAFTDFLDHYSIAGLEAILARTSVHRIILAIGLLLDPVRRSGTDQLQKSLMLPLPQSSCHRNLVAAFWLDLISIFLQREDFELSLFFTETRGEPVLVIGFNGASPETLAAIIDPRSAPAHQVNLDNTEWVDSLTASDAGVQKLSVYLEQGQLSLRSVHALFHETFD